MQRKLISLCMIVKDEEEHLPRCLQSVQGVVDEIIIVDTGSMDRTLEVAERFGARVIHCPWRNDFAYARNAGIELAEGEWILFLDADEELDPKDRDELRIYAGQEEFVGFMLHIHNHMSRNSHGATINPVLRMFRNHPQHRFQGKIHEQISIQICKHTPDAVFHVIDVKIHHYGYQHEVVIKKDKVRRNIGLLMVSIQEEPDNAFHYYNIGVEYLRMGKLQQSLEAFRKARGMLDPRTAHYVHLVYKYEIRCLCALAKYGEALELVTQALQLYPKYTDLLHDQALCEKEIGEKERAKTALYNALQLGAAPPGFHTEEGIGSFQTAYLLGQFHEAFHEYDRAIDWYLETLRLQSSFNPAFSRAFHLMRSLGQEDLIVPLLNEYFSFTSSQAIWRVMSLLIGSSCYHAALAWMEQQKNPVSEVEIIGGLICYMETGQLSKARRLIHNTRLLNNEAIKKSFRNIGLWIDWLEGISMKNKDGVISFFESDQAVPGHNQNFDSAEWWNNLGTVMKAAYFSGRKSSIHQMIESWEIGLGNQEEQSGEAGTTALVHSLARLADAHLSHLAQNSFHRLLVQAVRVSLPCEHGS